MNNEDYEQMIKYYKLYGRIGKLGNKYTKEAEKMHWMEPNSINKVLSYDEIESYFLNLSLSDFIKEIIQIFKEDGIWYEGLSLCLGLKENEDCKEGELNFQGSKINCKVKPEEHPHSRNVGELAIEMIKPFAELLGLSEIEESTKYKVDEFYDLELNLSRNSERKVTSLNLKHIRNQIKKSI